LVNRLAEFMAQVSAHLQLNTLRTELYQIVYQEPIYPKNLYMDREPMRHAEYFEKVAKKLIELMHQRNIWKKPEQY
jgi:hypothetical protein